MRWYPPPDHGIRCAAAVERSRLDRWGAPGAARVIHPTRGTVVVPCRSQFSALLCAAEVWGCDWLDIHDAGVWLAAPGEQAVKMPHIISGGSQHAH